MQNLAVIAAANPEMEALAIAIAMREAHELKKSAALVTPDRALARRVMAALGRWNLVFDDSGGDALTETSAGIFARLIAEAAAEQLEPATLLALLKHPLFRLGAAPNAWKDADRDARTRRCCAARGPRPAPPDWRRTSRASATSSASCAAAKRRCCMARSRAQNSMTTVSTAREELIAGLRTGAGAAGKHPPHQADRFR